MVTIPCLCGNNSGERVGKRAYEVTPEGVTQESDTLDLMFVKCDNCGIVRQFVDFSEKKQYEKFYKNYPPTTNLYGAKDYGHDLAVAEKRLKSYELKTDQKLLDVGSGSGAFVDVCRAEGIEAYGCELAEYDCSVDDTYIYKKDLLDIHFPTDYFDTVTCHDVLEHVIDPREFLQEMFRITKQEGKCIIDFPNFFDEEGKHHWKEEHIWYLNHDQLEILFDEVGFEFKKIQTPIRSKIVYTIVKPKQERVTVLVPPGMGDAYWSIVKVQSFMESIGRGGEVVDVSVACNVDRQYNGHKRAFPFIELFPFLNSTGETFNTDKYPKEIWLEAYRDAGRTIFEGICDRDYFLSWNGQLGNGNDLEKVDPEIKCNWIPPMFESLEQMNYEKEAKEKYGKYIIFYFLFHGHYNRWQEEFNKKQMENSVNLICKQTGCKAVFVGAEWDKNFQDQSDVINRIAKLSDFKSYDLRGKTSTQELFGLIKGSEVVVGYPSGLTIMSTVLKQKTVIIWNDYYNKDFMWNSCPPEVREKTYFVENTKNLTPKKLTQKVKEIIK